MKTADALVAIALPPSLPASHPDYTRERYSVDQAAAYLEVHRSRIYTLAAQRAIGHRVDGGRKRFSQADLDAWRAAHRREAAPAFDARRPRVVTADGVQAIALPAIVRRRFSD